MPFTPRTHAASNWLENAQWDKKPRLSVYVGLDAHTLPVDHPQRQQARAWLNALHYPNLSRAIQQSRLASHAN